MSHISRHSRRSILCFLIATFCAFALRFADLPVKNLDTSLYGVIVIAWTLTADRRILRPDIRRFLVSGGYLLLSLFVLRIFRYEIIKASFNAGKYLWYAYYVPFTAIPLCSFSASLCVGKRETERPLRRYAWLWLCHALLAAAILTNDLHGLMFRIIASPPGELNYMNGPLYPIYAAWCVSLTLASFLVFTRRCRLSQCRRLWYIPAAAAAVGFALLAWYVAVGGSPQLMGRKLYHVHEAYAILFIGLWEGCIQIGLIPSNSDYEEIFELSHINAALTDRRDAVVVQAADYGSEAVDADHVRRSHAVTGGEFIWIEDISAIHRLNEDIASAAETIEEENVLIAEENRIQAQMAHIAEQNRLYDKITDTLQPQLDAIDAALKDGRADTFRERLLYAAVLGVYMKRRANLELLADRRDTVSSDELFYAISESAEYLTLADKACLVERNGTRNIPADLLLAAYELFEAVAEGVYSKRHTFWVTIAAEDSFALTVLLDGDAPIHADWQRERLSRSGGVLQISREDETARIRLAAERRGDG